MVQRIVIMGSPGTGKSTLAYRIAQHTGLPLYRSE
ncbi:AAA family ATPase, partial [Staphylococcus agnetis]|nr:AAA family ATPase [Staphylococcus agnetis]